MRFTDFETHPSVVLPQVYASQCDGFTRAVFITLKLISMVLTVFLPVAWVMRLFGTLLMPLTFGLYATVYSIVLWKPVFGLLLGTSWLWLHCWPFRPVLAGPGIALAALGELILMCAPEDRDKDAVLWRVSFADGWPFSWKLMRAHTLGAVDD